MIRAELSVEFATRSQAKLFMSLLDVFDVEAYPLSSLEEAMVTVKIANANKAGLDQIYDIAELLNSDVL